MLSRLAIIEKIINKLEDPSYSVKYSNPKQHADAIINTIDYFYWQCCSHKSLSQIGIYYSEQELQKDEDDLLHFLLRVTCEHNMLQEMNLLLELYPNINQPLTFKKANDAHNVSEYNDDVWYGNDWTLLEIALYNKQKEMVEYLLEVKGAKASETNAESVSKLIYNEHYSSNGISLQKLANIVTCWSVPLKSVNHFCLEHALKEYVHHDKFAYGFNNFPELFDALEKLSEHEWYSLKRLILTEQSNALSRQDTPKLSAKKLTRGVLLGLFTMYMSYRFVTQDVRNAFTVGAFATTVMLECFKILTLAKQQTQAQAEEERIQKLFAQHGVFFKSAKESNLDHIDKDQNYRLALGPI